MKEEDKLGIIGFIVIMYLLISVAAAFTGLTEALSEQSGCSRYEQATRLRIALPAFEVGCWIGSKP